MAATERDHALADTAVDLSVEQRERLAPGPVARHPQGHVDVKVVVDPRA